MKTLKKLRNDSVKYYEVLQNRCGCGTCGCICSCGGTIDAQVHEGGSGNAESGYRINYSAHS